MKGRNLLLLALFVMLIACLVLSSGVVSGERVESESCKFQYAVKFVCGPNMEDLDRVLPGQYATAINIFNPHNCPAAICKAIVLTFPPAEQEPVAMLDGWIGHELGPLEALEVDCGEIPIEFVPPDTPVPSHVKGFLIIQSSRPLDVTAVYTAGSNSDVASIDVEQIKGRKIAGSLPCM